MQDDTQETIKFKTGPMKQVFHPLSLIYKQYTVSTEHNNHVRYK